MANVCVLSLHHTEAMWLVMMLRSSKISFLNAGLNYLQELQDCVRKVADFASLWVLTSEWSLTAVELARNQIAPKPLFSSCTCAPRQQAASLHSITVWLTWNHTTALIVAITIEYLVLKLIATPKTHHRVADNYTYVMLGLCWQCAQCSNNVYITFGFLLA